MSKKLYENAHGRNKARREREGWAKKAARLSPPTIAKPLTPSEAVTLYRIERAKAVQRWSEQGGPTCGFTSGRHPVARTAGNGMFR